jgi:hypothetical protein
MGTGMNFSDQELSATISQRPVLDSFADEKTYWKVQLWSIAAILLLLAVSLILALAFSFRLFELRVNARLTWFFFVHQDSLFGVLVLLTLLFKPQPSEQPQFEWWRPFEHPAVVVAFTLVLLGLCWAGRHLIYFDHNLSRDEQMADFDAYIFVHGRIFWPIALFWRPLAAALNQIFILPIGDHEGWVSGYLPINAAIRAVVGTFVSPALASPLLVCVGAIALWRVSLRLWPDSPSTRAVVLILYAGSSQVIITGMTAYAMTAHLALDLIWLALFLQNKKVSHVGAVFIGFMATGLHQPLFHPLFVLPFMWLLISERRLQLVAFYGVSYGLICAFWFIWPIWVSAHGLTPMPPHMGEGVDDLTRFLNLIHAPNAESLWLMALNLIRFITWQHLLLLPLVAIGLGSAWRVSLGRAIVVGFFLPIPVMLILLPYQGHGWGYRYVHGVIGNACLLGGYGWYALEVHGLTLRRALAWTSAATFLLVLPIRGYMAHQMVAPFAHISRMIATSGADLVIVEDNAAPFANDVVVNQPDLSNRPIRLRASELRPGDMKDLCAFGSVAFIDAPQLQPIRALFGLPTIATHTHLFALEQAAYRFHCAVAPLHKT